MEWTTEESITLDAVEHAGNRLDALRKRFDRAARDPEVSENRLAVLSAEIRLLEEAINRWAKSLNSDGHRSRRDSTNENKHLYSGEGYRDQIAKFADTAAARAVDQAVEQVRQRADKASAQVDKIRRQLSPNGDTAAELRAGKGVLRQPRVGQDLRCRGGSLPQRRP